jgi:hypothetical protein
MCYAMKIDAFVKECVGLSFLVYCSPILVWEELRFRQKWRFRLGALTGRRGVLVRRKTRSISSQEVKGTKTIGISQLERSEIQLRQGRVGQLDPTDNKVAKIHRDGV